MSYFDKALEKDDREDKLPKWAQEKLSYMRSAVDVYKKKAADANPITEDTLVVTDRYDEFPTPVKVGCNESVTFFARKFDGHDSFDVRLDGDDLLIHGSDSVMTHQQSGNVVRLKFLRGTFAQQAAENLEARRKGWSSEEIRLDKHLGHIPRRSDVHIGRTQAEIEAGK